MPTPSVRLATPADIPLLPAIERAAAALFPPADLPPALRAHTVAPGELRRAQRERRLWVAVAADGTVAGFALASRDGERAYLDEIDVHPRHAGRGLGRALVRAVADAACRQGLRSLALTTFGHLPWNAPFYARLGFVVLDDSQLCGALAGALAREAAAGLRQRVAMRLALPAPCGTMAPVPPPAADS
ncbi:GNAT family N-acetyltransferase [Cupriavidus sp. 30B13]|uniref:GNAT family N-acetyltransferase n=1 Tax=Cupriavidus sp. 30B13 TaxID=3384241 RepID=UPI003B9219D4